MRTAGKLVLAFTVSALATLGLINLLLTARPHLDRLLSAHATKEVATADTYGEAQRLAAAGHLREAQDGYLAVLRKHPGNAAAMRGLVAVRRSMAGGDPVLLRQQAAAYRQLAARHADTPEHYSTASMYTLAAANLQAAAAIEAERRAALDTGIGGAADPRRAAGRAGQIPRSAREARSAAPTAPSTAAPASPAAVPAPPPRSEAPAGPRPSPGPGPAAHEGAGMPAPPQSGAGAPATPRAAAGSTPPPASTGPGAGSQAAPSTPAPPSAPSPSPAAPQPAQPSTSPAGAPGPAKPPADSGTATSPTSTVAVVTPSGTPPSTQIQGDLAKVNCQDGTFVLHGANGDEEFATKTGTMIYVRGAKSERVSGVCALEHRLGQTVMVWFVAQGDRRLATSVTVIAPPEPGT
jgi:hypothetical protein